MQRYRSSRKQSEGDEPLPTVEAVKLTNENVQEVADWCTGQEVVETDAFDPHKHYVGLNVVLWDGVGRLSEGDYLVKDGLGSFHVRWASNFERDFEEVDDDGRATSGSEH